MKLFQQLLVATAALSLVAPLAAQASDFNIEGMNSYVRKKSTSRKQKQFNSNSFNNELATEKVESSNIELKGFEANSFSDTTTMDGKAIFYIGGVDGVKDIDDDEDGVLTDEPSDSVGTGYTFTMNLNTSFTGDDNLYIRLKGGDQAPQFGTKPGTYHIAAKDTDEDFNVDKIWYQFPIGDNITAFAGPRIENYYMYVTPSIYKPGALKALKLGGNSNFGASTDFGFGAKWEMDNGFAIATNVVDKAIDGAGFFQTSEVNTGDNASKWDTQIAFTQPNYHLSVTHSNSQNWTSQMYNATAFGEDTATDATGYAFRAYWIPPAEVTLLPEMSFGYDTKDWEDGAVGSADRASSYMVGLTWKDTFQPDDKIGVAYTKPLNVTDIVGGGVVVEVDPSLWEIYYSWKINDSMSVTPAIFGGTDTWQDEDDILGGVVTTTLKF